MTLPTPDKTLFGRARDKVAWAIMTFTLKYIATEWYSRMVTGSIRYGLAAAQKASADGK